MPRACIAQMHLNLSGIYLSEGHRSSSNVPSGLISCEQTHTDLQNHNRSSQGHTYKFK